MTMVLGIAAAGAVAGCGHASDPGPAATPVPSEPPRVVSPTATATADKAADRRAEQLDSEQETLVRQVERAARAGDREQVRRLEGRLTAVSRQSDAINGDSSADAKDAFDRELQRFRFKEAPLFVVQLTSTQGSHAIFVAIDKAQWCLNSARDRARRVEQVYVPMHRRLSVLGVNDFAFFLVPSTATNPIVDDALAIGRRGQVELTGTGRAC